MRTRGQNFIVIRKPSAVGMTTGLVRDLGAYASKPGDARRSGRAQGAAGLVPVVVEWAERANQIEARLGVVTVGAVTHDTTSKGYFWAVYLPGFVQTPRPAKDSDAAKRAILHKVKEWCEAAKLITARRA
jgi:hypothetical protein